MSKMNKDIMANGIGKRIRDVRESMKLSRKKFLEITGICNTALYNYEVGERIPSAEIIAQIGEATKRSTFWLLTGKGIETYSEIPNLATSIVEDLMNILNTTLSQNITEDERILIVHKWKNLMNVRLNELLNDHFTVSNGADSSLK